MKIGGTTISDLKVGSAAVQKVYLGSQVVWMPPAVGGFTPLDLFAGTEQGFWYDPSDLTTLFTDDAATTNATVGDAVAVMHDKSGNGNHATQTTAAKRPILRQSGSIYYLEFDGVDDTMQIPVAAQGAVGSDNTAVFALTPNNPGGFPYLLGMPGDKGFEMLFIGSSQNIRPAIITTSGVIVANGSVTHLGTPFIYSQDWTRSNGSLRAWGDQVLEVNASGTPANKTTAASFWMGSKDGTSSYIESNVYGGVLIDRKLTDTERGNLETYLADKSPVTL